ncbi:hypothetical protein ACFLY6_01265 [Candidatus Dependentiae bacterium]
MHYKKIMFIVLAATGVFSITKNSYTSNATGDFFPFPNYSQITVAVAKHLLKGKNDIPNYVLYGCEKIIFLLVKKHDESLTQNNICFPMDEEIFCSLENSFFRIWKFLDSKHRSCLAHYGQSCGNVIFLQSIETVTILLKTARPMTKENISGQESLEKTFMKKLSLKTNDKVCTQWINCQGNCIPEILMEKCRKAFLRLLSKHKKLSKNTSQEDAKSNFEMFVNTLLYIFHTLENQYQHFIGQLGQNVGENYFKTSVKHTLNFLETNEQKRRNFLKQTPLLFQQKICKKSTTIKKDTDRSIPLKKQKSLRRRSKFLGIEAAWLNPQSYSCEPKCDDDITMLGFEAAWI